jgi:hypothetical protein
MHKECLEKGQYSIDTVVAMIFQQIIKELIGYQSEKDNNGLHKKLLKNQNQNSPCCWGCHGCEKLVAQAR